MTFTNADTPVDRWTKEPVSAGWYLVYEPHRRKAAVVGEVTEDGDFELWFRPKGSDRKQRVDEMSCVWERVTEEFAREFGGDV